MDQSTPTMRQWLMDLDDSLLGQRCVEWETTDQLLHSCLEVLQFVEEFLRSRGLSESEGIAVLVYTAQTDIFSDANRALRNHQPDVLAPFMPFIQLLRSALPKLPSHDCVKGGPVSRMLNVRVVNYAPKKVVTWDGFTSTAEELTSEQMEVSGGGNAQGELTGALLLTAAHNGHSLGPLSFYPEESEILLDAGW